MSEETAMYKIAANQNRLSQTAHEWLSSNWNPQEPQGEICSRHDDEQEPEPEPEPGEYLDSLGRHITRLENLRSELNLAWLDIEPWIEQTKKFRKSKNGFKSCYPCADKFFAVMTNLSREIQALREEFNNG